MLMDDKPIRLVASVRLTQAEVDQALAEVPREDRVGRSDAVDLLDLQLRSTREAFRPNIPWLR